MKKILFLLMVLFLSGCAGVLNPYGDEFSCPKTYKGKCVSIQQAYEESLDPNFKEPDNNDYLYEANTKRKGCSSGNCGTGSVKSSSGSILSMDSMTLYGSSDNGEGAYLEGLYKKMTGLLKEPVTPVIVPPKIMRVLILSYTETSGDDLFMPRYVYFMADKPKWIVSDPFYGIERETE